LWALGQGQFINGGSVESRSYSEEKGCGVGQFRYMGVYQQHTFLLCASGTRQFRVRQTGSSTFAIILTEPKYPFVNFIGVVRIDIDGTSSSSSSTSSSTSSTSSTSSSNSNSRRSIKDTYSTTEAARSSLDEALKLTTPAKHGSGMIVGEKKKKENKKAYEAAEDAERMLKPR
jgi:hypothetical protein